MSFPHVFNGNPPGTVIPSDATSLKTLLKQEETHNFVSLRTTGVFPVVKANCVRPQSSCDYEGDRHGKKALPTKKVSEIMQLFLG